MTTKLIENIDDELWNKFVGLSKIDNKTVGKLLNEVLKDYLKRRNIR